MRLEDRLEEAHRAWQQAITVFNNARTPEDIDFAVYNLEAKRRLYAALLRQAREEKKETDFE